MFVKVQFFLCTEMLDNESLRVSANVPPGTFEFVPSLSQLRTRTRKKDSRLFVLIYYKTNEMYSTGDTRDLG